MKKMMGLVMVLAIGCTGGDEPTDYMALPPADAARALAEDLCEVYFTCGILDEFCDDSGRNCRLAYEPAITRYASKTECIAEEADEIAELLGGCVIAKLDAQQKALLNGCFNSVNTCLSPEQLAQRTDDDSIECEVAEPVFELCDLCEEAPEDDRCR